LEQLPELLSAKRRLYERYTAAFEDLPQVRLMGEPVGCTSNFWLQTLILSESVADERDNILSVTNDAGLMTRPIWTLMHRLNPYVKCPRMEMPVAESLERRVINIPSSSRLAIKGEL